MRSSRMFREMPVGRIGVEVKDGKLTRVFLPGSGEDEVLSKCPEENAVAGEALRQLEEYFAGKRREFALPLALEGTPFMLRVWQALLALPYGATASYQEIARAVGAPRAVRAVGGANHRNPIPIVIPCHRVIGKNGKPVGYGGGLPLKLWLLAHEREVAELGPAADVGATPR